MCLARTVQPLVTETSSPNTYEHFRTRPVDCKMLEQAVRRFASHHRSTGVCSVAAPLSEYLPTFRRSWCLHFQGTSSPKRMNFLHCLTVKAKALRRFETSGTSGQAKKNGFVVCWTLKLWSSFICSFLCTVFHYFFFMISPFPFFFYPIIRSSICHSFIHSLLPFCPLFFCLSRVSVIAPLPPYHYFTLPRVVSGSGAISVLRNVPSSATVISDGVKLTVEFLATLFLLQTTDSRSLAFKAGFLQFLHS